MTLNQMIALFKAMGDAHYFIKTTEFGEVPEKVDANTESTKYPAFYQVPTNTVTRDNVVERSFSFIVCDLVYPGHSNINEVLSDTEQTLNDFIKVLRQESDDYTLVNDPTLVPFKDGFGDDVTGWYVEVVIQTENNTGYCDLPMLDFGFPGQGGSSGLPSHDFTCEDLEQCPKIIAIDETLIDLQEQIDNLPPSALTLNQVLGYGNVTGPLDIILTQLQKIVNSASANYLQLDDGSNNAQLFAEGDLTLVADNGQMYLNSHDVNVQATNFNVTANNSINNLAVNVFDTTVDNGSYLGKIEIQTKPAKSYINLYTFNQINGYNSSIYAEANASDNTITISSNNPTFTGVQYGADYSTNFTNRTLVDKEYVDLAIAGATPVTPTIAQVLTAGNTLNVGQYIQGFDTSTYLTLDNGFYVEYSTSQSASLFLDATSSLLFHTLLNKFDAPINEFTANVKVDNATINTLTYFDGSKYLKSITLGAGLSLVGNTLSALTPSLSGTAPIVYTAGVISITQATTSTNGYLSSTDWNTFNNKQPQLNGTGFVKATGTTISYDNSVYITASALTPYLLSSTAALTYVPYTGATSNVTLGLFSMSAQMFNISGTAGNGYLEMIAQSSAPATPASGTLRLYTDASGRLSWISQLGFSRTFRSSALTGNRLYTLQDRDGILADDTDLALKVNKTNSVLLSYLEIPEQSVPSTPTNAFRLYADTSNRLAWIGENGFTRTFDGTANTANRIYVLPDNSGTIALLSDLTTGYVPYTGATTNVNLGSNNFTVTGSITTGMSGSASRVVEAGSGGALTATKDIIDGFLLAGSAPAILLTNVANWTAKVYTGTAITGTYQGQQFFDNNYYFVAVNDNDWIRTARA